MKYSSGQQDRHEALSLQERRHVEDEDRHEALSLQALPHNDVYLCDPTWISSEMERVALLVPEVSHSATGDLLSYALAYAERYTYDVLQLEQEWRFLYAALIEAWRQSQHVIIIRLVHALAYLVCRPSTSAVAEHILRLGIGASRRMQDWQHLTHFLNRLGCLLTARGRYSQGWRIWCKSLELARASGSSHGLWEPLASFVYIADMLGNYQAAHQFAESLQHTDGIDAPDMLAVAVFVRGFFARTSSNLERAFEDFSYSLRLLSTGDHLGTLLQADGRSPGYTPPGTPPSAYRQLFSMAVQTELARAQGDYARAQELAEITLSLAQLFGDYYTLVELLIDQIVFTFQQRQFTDTVAGFIRLHDVIRQYEAHHLYERCRCLEQLMNDYVPGWRRLAGSSSDPLLPTIVSSELLEPLSEREIEILQLVAGGLSNSEIAGRLVITRGTVKKHLEHIYSKLDAHSRTAAIVRARTLHLL
ncbi:MAG TPA: response regulator transcription factor [Ktedonobacteraceae bacterium]|nr:response regulator transcription factor [Ktedonobacteraceae bacterium]